MKVTKIEQKITPEIKVKKRVAAYARVSEESERLLHSLSTQISYYSVLIQKNPDWVYAGVYADNGISGTGLQNRSEFNRLIQDCEKGMIDIILVKSISRFARNTVDLLKTVRRLHDLGIEVHFEKEGINTATADGELLLTLLAGFAQEESRSISENVKWGTRKRFQQGIPNGRHSVYGYRWEEDQLVIVPEEAEVVRLIYKNYLDGKSAEQTENQLREMGVTTRSGEPFTGSTIRKMLVNITYSGSLLLQKEYVADPLTHHKKNNRGELPQYLVENDHEPIIPPEMFQAVQDEMKRKRECGIYTIRLYNSTCFAGRIICGKCGTRYRRGRKQNMLETSDDYFFWECGNKLKGANRSCNCKRIPEKALISTTCEVLDIGEFDDTVFKTTIDHITVIGTETLQYHFFDGRIVDKKWVSTAKKDSWTEERKRNFSEQRKRRRGNPCTHNYNDLTGLMKCPCCGKNYVAQTVKYKDGSKTIIWSCRGSCRNKTIKDETMKALICDVLALPEFSVEAMDAQIEKVEMYYGRAHFIFYDGHTEDRKYTDTRHEHDMKHTEEYKAHMSELLKQKWADGRMTPKKKRSENNG